MADKYSRRSFLQLIGLGAGAALVAPPKLFGTESDRSTIWMPGDGVIATSNHVVYRLPPTTFLGETTAVQRAESAGRPFFRALAPYSAHPVPSWKINKQEALGKEYHVRCGPDDPHVSFIKASAAIQRQLAQDAVDVLMALPAHQRQGAQIVTIIYSPIHARPKHDADTGFDVFCDATVRVDRGAGDNSIASLGYAEYSKTGKYPIDVPSDLDFGLLMKRAEEVMRYEYNRFGMVTGSARK